MQRALSFLSSAALSTLLLCSTGACSSSGPATGSGGAPPAGGGGSSGGAPASGGAGPASGGSDVGSGGVPGSGGAPGGGGSGAGGGPGAGGAPGSGGSGAGDCTGLPVCDDFESVAAGQPPASATWSVELDYSGQGNAQNVLVSADDAHSPSQSVKIAGQNTAPWNFQYANPGETFYARALIKTADPGSSGTAVIGVGLNSTHGDEIRLRFFGGKITLNSASGGDGLSPDPSVCTACTDVPVGVWFCAEMFYDSSTDTARIWIDSELAAEVVNNTGWHSGGSFPAAAERIWFGTLAPNGPAPLVYIDDVAIGPNRIGCP